jgi:DNA-binding NarL/FixJ family response regulator
VTLHLPQHILANRPEPAAPPLAGTHVRNQTASDDVVRIVIAEDHEVIAEGLTAIVRSLDGFTVVAAVSTSVQLFAAMQEYEPEIVIVDAVFERSTGLELVYALKVRWPNIRIIILSPYDDVVYANEVLRHGVNGFLLKTVRREEVAQALQTVSANRQYVTPELVAGLNALRNPWPLETTAWKHDVLRSLTFRERELFYLVLAGRTSQQIGEALNISHRTVETHRRNFMKKLGVNNINELHRFAVQHQLMIQE